MTSFQLSLTPHRRAAARFVDKVHRCLQKAYADAPEVTQSDIANKLGVHRSVINRQLRGRKDMTVGRVAELAWAMGYEADFELLRPQVPDGCNTPLPAHGINPFTEIAKSSTSSGAGQIPEPDLVMAG